MALALRNKVNLPRNLQWTLLDKVFDGEGDTNFFAFVSFTTLSKKILMFSLDTSQLT
jgi:hypothetical protein